MGVKYCYDYSMNKIIVLFVIVIAVSGCAPKLLGVSENPPKIYIQVPKMAHPEAYKLAQNECKKLNSGYKVDTQRTYATGMTGSAQDLKDSWLGIKPLVQSVTGTYTFYCK